MEKNEKEFYIDPVMSGKTEKEKYSMFLLAISEDGREIFSTWNLPKKKDANGADTDEVVITVNELFANCLPKKNIILERMIFFRGHQISGEPLETFLADLRRLSSTSIR